jgi:hypothetical protein
MMKDFTLTTEKRHSWEVFFHANLCELGRSQILPSPQKGPDGQERFIVIWEDAGEIFYAIYEVRPDTRNRAITLVTFFIKSRGRERLGADTV